MFKSQPNLQISLIFFFFLRRINKFSYFIITHFIASNKYYHSCHNPHSLYQTYPYFVKMFNFNLNNTFKFVSKKSLLLTVALIFFFFYLNSNIIEANKTFK